VKRAFTACALTMLLPIAAAAQTPDEQAPPQASEQPPAQTQPPAQSRGPMIIEQVHNGFLIAPEVKATLFDKKVQGLVGGSAGWVFDDTLFVGGGGYWMAQRRGSDRQLAYGGAVVQWFGHNGGTFGWSAKALLGGGEATLPETVTQIILPPVPDPRAGRPTPPTPQLPPRTVTITVRERQDFLVAEPELNARFSVSKHVRLTVGAGYRFTGTASGRGRSLDSDRRLNGVTGTFGIQIGL
jgi:hypothetical protein